MIVTEELQSYLVNEGVGQLPEADPSPTVPSIWTNPRYGAVMPRISLETPAEWLENVTVTVADGQLQGPPGLASYLLDTFVIITTRARKEAEGILLHRQIRSLLHPPGSPIAGRCKWQMNDLAVLYSRIWRTEQPLPPIENGLTYDRTAWYLIECARSDLES